MLADFLVGIMRFTFGFIKFKIEQSLTRFQSFQLTRPNAQLRSNGGKSGGKWQISKSFGPIMLTFRD